MNIDLHGLAHALGEVHPWEPEDPNLNPYLQQLLPAMGCETLAVGAIDFSQFTRSDLADTEIYLEEQGAIQDKICNLSNVLWETTAIPQLDCCFC